MLKVINLEKNTSRLTYKEVFDLLHLIEDKTGPIMLEVLEPETATEEENPKSYEIDGKRFLLTRKRFRTLANRPYRPALSKEYRNEFLRREFRCNGESVILAQISKDHVEPVDGQHRGIGFLMAVAEYVKRPTYFRKRYKLPKLEEFTFDTLVVGNCPTEFIDSINRGQKRSGADVLFRKQVFKGEFSPEDYRHRKTLHEALAVALRLVWIRVGGRQVSDAPKFPPSEMRKFLKEHPRLPEFVWYLDQLDQGDEDTSGKNVRQFMSVGYAAALCYLFATSGFDEAAAGDKMFVREKDARSFWKRLVLGAELPEGSPVLALRNILTKRAEAGGSKNRDETVSLCVKAWNFFSQKKGVKVHESDLKLTKDERTTEFPRCGGLDACEVASTAAEPSVNGDPHDE